MDQEKQKIMPNFIQKRRYKKKQNIFDAYENKQKKNKTFFSPLNSFKSRLVASEIHFCRFYIRRP